MQALVASLGTRRQMRNMLHTESGKFHSFFFASVPECIEAIMTIQ